MREKDFLKNKKKLVAPKDYVIGDATDNTSGEITKFSNLVSLDGLKPPKNLVNLILNDSDKLDPDKIEKLEKRYIKSQAFRNAAIGLIMSQVQSDKNYFIVFRDKDWKAYGKTIFRKFKKLFPCDEDVMFTFSDIEDNFKILSKALSEDARRELDKSTKKLIKKLEEQEKEKEESKEKKKKKKKDKDSDKKKKKKKKKKDKYLFIE